MLPGRIFTICHSLSIGNKRKRMVLRAGIQFIGHRSLVPTCHESSLFLDPSVP